MKRGGLFPREQARQTKAPAALDAYWTLTTELLLSELHTTRKGIQQINADSRLKQYGWNALKAQQKNTAFGLLLRQFKSPLVLILIFASSVSAFGGE